MIVKATDFWSQCQGRLLPLRSVGSLVLFATGFLLAKHCVQAWHHSRAIGDRTRWEGMGGRNEPPVGGDITD